MSVRAEQGTAPGLLEAALGDVGLAVFTYDRASGLRIGVGCEALFGAAPGEGDALTWLASRVEGGEPDSLRQSWDALLDGARAELQAELRVRLPGGLAQVRHVARREGETVVGTLQRVLSESQRREAERSERRFRAIYENAPVMIDAFGPDGSLLLWNRECERRLGYGAEEVAACADPMALFYPDEETRAAVLESILAPDGQFREFQVQTREGPRAQRWANFALPDGEVISVGFDVTDLRASHDALERSNRELEEFAYVASHDLQEPLRMVRSYVSLLEEEVGPQLDDDARAYMAFAVEGATRMQGLVQDLLEYSRAQHVELERREVDLDQVLAAVLVELEPARAACAGVVEAGPLPTLAADPGQIHRLLLNLVGNALKFHRPEQPASVRISARREGAAWRVEVADDGIGFDPRHQDKVFRMFQRLNKRSAYEGNGIGLAICRQIALRHGGEIGVETTPGVGSTFWFTLSA